MLAGLASVEVSSGFPLVLDGEAVLELPAAAGHPGYPLALAVSAVFAAVRADVAGAEELSRRASEANARSDTPDWRVEETTCSARASIATIRGAFADAARYSEQAASLARAGGDLADASVHLTFAVGSHLIADDAPAAVPLANEALALARQVGAPALIAASLLAVGAAVADTDPEQARACLRESRELSATLGYQKPMGLTWEAAIAFLVGDQAATLDLGRRAIHGLEWGVDRIRVGIVLYMIAAALTAIRPEAAAIIQGAAEAHAIKTGEWIVELITSTVAAALGEERARELRARGADMDWDQAVDYTLTQTTQALSALQSAP